MKKVKSKKVMAFVKDTDWVQYQPKILLQTSQCSILISSVQSLCNITTSGHNYGVITEHRWGFSQDPAKDVQKEKLVVGVRYMHCNVNTSGSELIWKCKKNQSLFNIKHPVKSGIMKYGSAALFMEDTQERPTQSMQVNMLSSGGGEKLLDVAASANSTVLLAGTAGDMVKRIPEGVSRNSQKVCRSVWLGGGGQKIMSSLEHNFLLKVAAWLAGFLVAR